MKKHKFKLPESKQLAVDQAKTSDLVDAQGLPVYALIPAKNCDTESPSPGGGGGYTKMECKLQFEGGGDGGIW